MVQMIRFHRSALQEMLRSSWTDLWIVTSSIDDDAVALILPHLSRPGTVVRVLVDLSAERLEEGYVSFSALHRLRSLPNCEVRTLRGLSSCVYALGPGGPALVSDAPLTIAGLDGQYSYGALLPNSGDVITDLHRWWQEAKSLDGDQWADLATETSSRLEARTIGEDLARIGAFVRVSVRGTRKSRRLAPKDFGVTEGEWGRVVRPVEVALYKLDDVIRAKEDLEAVLAEKGLEWNGYYLVPRHFIDKDWPRLFAAKERQLRDRLTSPEGEATLKAQLDEARRELEAFFAEVYSRVDARGLSAEAWVTLQATRVLAEAVSGSILTDSALEYRVLTILPEDPRSARELNRLLQDPKLRSVQLSFPL